MGCSLCASSRQFAVCTSVFRDQVPKSESQRYLTYVLVYSASSPRLCHTRNGPSSLVLPRTHPDARPARDSAQVAHHNRQRDRSDRGGRAAVERRPRGADAARRPDDCVGGGPQVRRSDAPGEGAPRRIGWLGKSTRMIRAMRDLRESLRCTMMAPYE